jgi:Retrotransposon gag protein
MLEIMASFDLEKASKIIPEFAGDYRSINNFVNLIEFYHDTLKEQDKPKLVKFILLTKFSSKAQNKIGSTTDISTFNELKLTLLKTFKSPKNSLMIHSELVRTKQNGQSLGQYIEKIETLIAELNSLQINELGVGSKDVIMKLNDQIALNTFKQGLNDRIRPTIFAAQPKTFNDAKSLASEVETPQDTSTILHFNSRNYRQNNIRSRNNYQNLSRNKNNYQKQTGNNTNYQNQARKHQNHQYINKQITWQNNNQGRPQGGRNNHNMYLMQSGNFDAVPEQSKDPRDLVNIEQ